VEGQAFVKTQNTAHMIKDLVEGELRKMEARPDVIIDRLEFNQSCQKLISGNKSTISAVAAAPAEEIPTRAYRRAINPQSGPADKDRQVHTSVLLEGHARASRDLLMNIPGGGIETQVFNTNVKEGPAQLIGVINTTKGSESIDVRDLRTLSDFLGKANLNPEATGKAHLYYDDTKFKHRNVNTDAHKAEQLLMAAIGTPPEPAKGKLGMPPYEIRLSTPEGETYAVIKYNASKKDFDISLDASKFDEAMKGPAKGVLEEIAKQIYARPKGPHIETVKAKVESRRPSVSKTGTPTTSPRTGVGEKLRERPKTAPARIETTKPISAVGKHIQSLEEQIRVGKEKEQKAIESERFKRAAELSFQFRPEQAAGMAIEQFKKRATPIVKPTLGR
jgi:hypothetical protein